MITLSKEEKIKYNVGYSKDTEFSAFARYLQSKWRVEKGYPESKLGNFLELKFAMETKSNFLTENIRNLVTQELRDSKKSGALISEPRIWNNLLSSQPLCFNLFGELCFDKELASKYFNQLFPSKVEKITAIKFEYSPGRRNEKYNGDNSAFDVFIEYSYEQKIGFIGIEVKYAESLKEETQQLANKNYKDRYAEITNSCGLFQPDSVDFLRQPPISQIWRDHLLSIVTKQDYDEGFFVFMYPSQNKECEIGVNKYRTLLASTNEEVNGFYARYLEDFIDNLNGIINNDLVNELKQRYVGNEDLRTFDNN